jgi:hypothetical protein
MSFEILSGRDELPVGSDWRVTLADYSRHVAPSIEVFRQDRTLGRRPADSGGSMACLSRRDLPADR